jgi:hypothetical protein
VRRQVQFLLVQIRPRREPIRDRSTQGSLPVRVKTLHDSNNNNEFKKKV